MLLSIFSIALVIGFGCKGDTGPVGPKGAKGEDGNANVVIDTFTVANADWASGTYWLSHAPNAALGWASRYYDRTDSAVTQGVLDSGMVLVFFKSYTSHANEWTILPFSMLNTFAGFNYNFVFETSVASVRLHIYFTPWDASSTPPSVYTYTFPAYTFKIVSVAGTLKSKMVESGVNTQDYGAVMKFIRQNQEMAE